MKQIHLIIHGRVQGVFYRDSTRRKASELGLKGYVKNLPDGTVEVVAQGLKEKLELLLDWCWQGSSSAKVKDIDVEWQEPENFTDFSVRY